MKKLIVLLLAILVALSNADKRTDWVISPNVSPSGVKCTSSTFWDYRSNLLFYLAPEDGKVYSLDPATNETNSVDVEKNTVFIQPTEKPDCIIYGVKNQIKTLEWDGKGAKKGGDVLATINEVGPDATILAGAISLQGNLTFIVEGTKEDKKAWYIYSMKLDMPPFKLHLNALNGVSQHIDSLYWTCKKQYLYTTSSERHMTEQLKYYQAIGFLQLRSISAWYKTYRPLGESKESTENNTYQIMNYSNNDKAEICELVGAVELIEDYATAPVKMMTSLAFGGTDLKTLYITSKKTPKDQLSAAGGLFSCDSIGAIGRPAFIATSTLNPDVDYCETPKPDLVVPMTPAEIEAKCKAILSGSVSVDASAGGQAGGKASVGIKIDAKFCAKFDAQFKGQAAGGVTGKPGGSIGGVTGKPKGGIGGVTGKPGGGSGGVSGWVSGGVTGKPGGGSGGVTGKPGGGSGGVTGKPGGGSGGVTGKPGGGSGGVTGKPVGGGGGVTGSPGGGSDLTASTPCYLPPTPAS